MFHNKKISSTPIDQWPADWDKLLTFFEISEADNTNTLWKELVTTYLREEPLADQSADAYKNFFKTFWTESRQDLRHNPEDLIEASRMGLDIYVKNILSSSSQDKKASLMKQTTALGNMPLHLATERKHILTVTLLLESGANANAPGESNKKPVHMATYNNDLILTQRLLQAGAIINPRNSDNEMPIHTAAMMGAADVVELFLKLDPELKKATGKDNCTAFIRAALDDDDTKVMKVLLRHGDDINQVNLNLGYGALHIAALKNKPQMIDYLVTHGVDVNMSGTNNRTALQFCAAQRRPPVAAITALIKNGADVNMGNPSPLELIESNANQTSPQVMEVIRLLRESGAQAETSSPSASPQNK